MNLLTWLSNHFFSSTKPTGNPNQYSVPSNNDINPASGLPMVDGIGSIDIAGNSYGFNDSSNEIDALGIESWDHTDSNIDNIFTDLNDSSSSFY